MGLAKLYVEAAFIGTPPGSSIQHFQMNGKSLLTNNPPTNVALVGLRRKMIDSGEQRLGGGIARKT